MTALPTGDEFLADVTAAAVRLRNLAVSMNDEMVTIMTPGLAMAIADLLEREADLFREATDRFQQMLMTDGGTLRFILSTGHAFVLARTVLDAYDSDGAQ